MDVARSEAVEADLDRFIERRSTRKPGPDERDELWKASVAAYNVRRREENRAARVEYHSGQVVRLRAVLESLIAGHEEQGAKLVEAQPKGRA
jgi:hypothetical protein